MLKRGVRPIEYILVLVKQTLCQEQLQRKFIISSDVLKNQPERPQATIVKCLQRYGPYGGYGPLVIGIQC